MGIKRDMAGINNSILNAKSVQDDVTILRSKVAEAAGLVPDHSSNIADKIEALNNILIAINNNFNTMQSKIIGAIQYQNEMESKFINGESVLPQFKTVTQVVSEGSTVESYFNGIGLTMYDGLPPEFIKYVTNSGMHKDDLKNLLIVNGYDEEEATRLAEKYGSKNVFEDVGGAIGDLSEAAANARNAIAAYARGEITFSEMTQTVGDYGKMYVATHATVNNAVLTGEAQLLETVVDGVIVTAAGLASIVTVMADGAIRVKYGNQYFDYYPSSTEMLWDNVANIVNVDVVGNVKDDFYDTSAGQWISENSALDPNGPGVQGIEKTTEFLAGAAIAVVTGGAFSPAVAGALGFLSGIGKKGEEILGVGGEVTAQQVLATYLNGVATGAEWYSFGTIGSGFTTGVNSNVLTDIVLDSISTTSATAADQMTGGDVTIFDYALGLAVSIGSNLIGEKVDLSYNINRKTDDFISKIETDGLSISPDVRKHIELDIDKTFSKNSDKYGPFIAGIKTNKAVSELSETPGIYVNNQNSKTKLFDNDRLPYFPDDLTEVTPYIHGQNSKFDNVNKKLNDMFADTGKRVDLNESNVSISSSAMNDYNKYTNSSCSAFSTLDNEGNPINVVKYSETEATIFHEGIHEITNNSSGSGLKIKEEYRGINEGATQYLTTTRYPDDKSGYDPIVNVYRAMNTNLNSRFGTQYTESLIKECMVDGNVLRFKYEGFFECLGNYKYSDDAWDSFVYNSYIVAEQEKYTNKEYKNACKELQNIANIILEQML